MQFHQLRRRTFITLLGGAAIAGRPLAARAQQPAPRLAARPRLQIAQPAALLEALAPGGYVKVTAGSKETSKRAVGAVRHGSRPALVGTLALAVVIGLIAERRL